MMSGIQPASSSSVASDLRTVFETLMYGPAPEADNVAQVYVVFLSFSFSSSCAHVVFVIYAMNPELTFCRFYDNNQSWIYRSLQNVQGHRANRVITDHVRTLILTLNLTLILTLNPKALTLSQTLTLNPVTNLIWCDPVSLYVLQWTEFACCG